MIQLQPHAWSIVHMRSCLLGFLPRLEQLQPTNLLDKLQRCAANALLNPLETPTCCLL